MLTVEALGLSTSPRAWRAGQRAEESGCGVSRLTASCHLCGSLVLLDFTTPTTSLVVPRHYVGEKGWGADWPVGGSSGRPHCFPR